VWDSATGEERWRFDDSEGSGWLSVDFSPDGTRLVAGNENGRLLNFDAAEGVVLQAFTGHTNWVMSVAYSPDGTKIASGSSDDSIILWDVEDESQLGDPITGLTNDVWAVAFSADGKILASADDDYVIRLWDVETHEPVGEPLAGHSDSIYALAFSPDGKILASGSRDMSVILWDTATWTQVAQLVNGHDDSVFGVAFSPDGKTLASGSADGTITLWDTTTYQPVSEPFATEPDWVNALAFSADGNYLAAAVGGTDNIASETALFSLDAPDALETACAIAGRNLTWDEWTRYMGDAPYRRTCADLPVHFSVIDNLGRKGNAAAAAGDTESARTFYSLATEWAVGSKAASSSNNLCWFGSIYGFADVVLPACEDMMNEAPSSGYYTDTRGLARALTGDTEAAIADFQAFVDWTEVYGLYSDLATQRLQWIVRLTAGDNPFDEETLEQLKSE
jgi:WD40 repeat protein